MLHYDILWFDIAMDYFEGVKIPNSLTYLLNDIGYGLFSKFPLFFDHFVKLSRSGEFHDQIDVELVMQHAIQFSDIGMIQAGLYLDFPDHLPNNILLDDDPLLNLLNSTYKPRANMLSHIDLPKLPTPNLHTQHKITNLS